MAAAGVVVEKGFEHDGLRLDRERTALDDCRMGIILEAMTSVRKLPQDASGSGNIKPGSTSRDFESERRGRRRTIVCGLEFAEKHRNEFTSRPTSAAAADFGLGGALEPLANQRGGHCTYAALPLVQASASLSSFADPASNHNTAHEDPFRSATKLTIGKGLYMSGHKHT